MDGAATGGVGCTHDSASLVHIFIDESGTFTTGGSEHSVSVVGALVVPDTYRARLEAKYGRLRRDLPQEGGEVKGRLLSEQDVALIVTTLRRHQVLFEVSAIDVGAHADGAIAAHQAEQAVRFPKQLTAKHHPNIHEAVRKLQERLQRMSAPLYAQSQVTIDVVDRVIRHSTLYYCQRIPEELGAFHWVVDAKNPGGVTAWEDWWSYVVMPALQSKSLREPLTMLKEGDYRHFERFNTTMGDHLKPYIESGKDSEEAGDVGLIIREHFRFSSEPEPGLELADIMTNAVRRAMTGHLGRSGWEDIPRLMIHRKQHYVRVLALQLTQPLRATSWPYMPVLKHFETGGKNMLAPRFNS